MAKPPSDQSWDPWRERGEAAPTLVNVAVQMRARLIAVGLTYVSGGCSSVAPVDTGQSSTSGAVSTGAASASHTTDPVPALVAELAAQAAGSARGPDVPVIEAGQLNLACEQGGQAFVDGSGACQQRGQTQDLDVGADQSGDLAPCAVEVFSLYQPFDTPPGEPFRFVVEQVRQTGVGRLSYNGRGRFGTTECGIRLDFRMASLVFPRFTVGQELLVQAESRSNDAVELGAGFSIVRDPDGTLLWAYCTGSRSLGDRFCPLDDLEVEVEVDPAPTCVLNLRSTFVVSGFTFRAGGGSCHVEPYAANCCTLWGAQYRVQATSAMIAAEPPFDGPIDGSQFLIVRDDVLDGPVGPVEL